VEVAAVASLVARSGRRSAAVMAQIHMSLWKAVAVAGTASWEAGRSTVGELEAISDRRRVDCTIAVVGTDTTPDAVDIHSAVAAAVAERMGTKVVVAVALQLAYHWVDIEVLREDCGRGCKHWPVVVTRRTAMAVAFVDRMMQVLG
jgi:hypothetical protein